MKSSSEDKFDFYIAFIILLLINITFIIYDILLYIQSQLSLANEQSNPFLF